MVYEVPNNRQTRPHRPNQTTHSVPNIHTPGLQRSVTNMTVVKTHRQNIEGTPTQPFKMFKVFKYFLVPQGERQFHREIKISSYSLD